MNMVQPKEIDEDKIRMLKPAFDRSKGTITAGNASSISDGAAALVVVDSETAHHSDNIKPLARLVSFADAEQKPVDFPTTPTLAVHKALR